ncbi:MAG: hypothetical protein HY289_11960 [Planctomycetes bacterium]|nr:hypothetical protein [Planctomycetota bacterium]
MQRVLLAAIFAILLTASSVRADIPLPAGTRYIDPRVRFIGIEKLDGYVFFMLYEAGDPRFSFGPVQVPVKNDREITVSSPGKYFGGTRLLAIARKDFDKLKKGSIDEKTPGVLIATFPAPPNTASRFLVRAPLSEYRVTLKDGKFDVKPASKLLRSEAAPLPAWSVVIACAFSLAAVGIVLLRRRTT